MRCRKPVARGLRGRAAGGERDGVTSGAVKHHVRTRQETGGVTGEASGTGPLPAVQSDTGLWSHMTQLVNGDSDAQRGRQRRTGGDEDAPVVCWRGGSGNGFRKKLIGHNSLYSISW